jgi:hypothetical protein
MVTTNVRHLPLFEAEYKICESLLHLFHAKGGELDVIHGYNFGTAIRRFVRHPKGLRRKLNADYPELPSIMVRSVQPGLTKIAFTNGGK